MAANGIVDSSTDIASVTIPAEYVADFRAAVVHEIRWEAECILGVKGGEVFNPDVAFEDIRSDADLMMQDADLYDQLETATKLLAGELGVSPDYMHANRVDLAGDKGAVELNVKELRAVESLPHAFEAMARQVVGPRLQEALGVGPIDSDYAEGLFELTTRLEWAVSRASEFHDKAAEARELAGGRS